MTTNDADVVDLRAVREAREAPAPENVVMVCDCGCQSFLIHPDQTARCQHCEQVYTEAAGIWVHKKPLDTVEEDALDTPIVSHVSGGEDADFSWRHFQNTLRTRKPSWVFFVTTEGHIGAYTGPGGALNNRRDVVWMRKRMRTLMRLIREPG